MSNKHKRTRLVHLAFLIILNQIGDEYSVFPSQLRAVMENGDADGLGPKDDRLNGEVSQLIKHQLAKKAANQKV